MEEEGGVVRVGGRDGRGGSGTEAGLEGGGHGSVVA